MEGESRTVRGGWPAAVVRIQCFGFDSRGRRHDEALLKDEVEATSSSRLHGKEA
jgi:hypothetical protein